MPNWMWNGYIGNKAVLTEIMWDENDDMKDRLKPSEFIVKTNGAFIEKRELQGGLNNKI